MSDTEQRYTWLDAADEVLDAAVEEESVVECDFEDFEVDVPLRFGEDAPFARWGLDGTVRIRVDGLRRPLAEWLRMWEEGGPRGTRPEDPTERRAATDGRTDDG